MKIVDITIIKPNKSINVKGECNHKHMQIVALNGSTSAINEALIGPIRLTPIRYIENTNTTGITASASLDFPHGRLATMRLSKNCTNQFYSTICFPKTSFSKRLIRFKIS